MAPFSLHSQNARSQVYIPGMQLENLTVGNGQIQEKRCIDTNFQRFLQCMVETTCFTLPHMTVKPSVNMLSIQRFPVFFMPNAQIWRESHNHLAFEDNFCLEDRDWNKQLGVTRGCFWWWWWWWSHRKLRQRKKQRKNFKNIIIFKKWKV